MSIAYVSHCGRGATDARIAALVDRLRQRGLRVAGTVQTNLEQARAHPCDMELLVLPAGPVYRIGQELGSASRGCRLDGGVLEDAVMQASLHLTTAQVLVVNKFGKLEAGGRGFVPLIAEALDRGIPVLIGVNAFNLDAFLAFSDGAATPLSEDPAEFDRWIEAALVA